MSVNVDQSKLRHRQHDNFTRLDAEQSKSGVHFTDSKYTYSFVRHIADWCTIFTTFQS